MLTPVENGIDLQEISRSGSVLQIHYDDFEDTIHEKMAVLTVEDTLGEPPQKSFEELAKDMVTVDTYGFIKKKILEEGGGDIINENCTVGIAYSGYFEGEKTSFYVRPQVKPLDCNMREGTLLCGLHAAVLTMKVGELSVFFLSYRVMYGEMGNPPKVKPKADCLFYIRVVRSRLTPDIVDSADEPNNFKNVLRECKLLFKNGSSFYRNSNTSMAIRCFNKAVNKMHRTRLADEEEEKKQEELLLKLYYNLAICYNYMNNPRRTCCMCKEINRLQTIWKNGKALYQNAKALRMLGAFHEAERKLKQVLKLCPDMKQEVEGEMKKITNQMNAYRQSKLIASKIIQQSSEVSEQFKSEVENLVKVFANDLEICKIYLPENLNEAEFKFVQEKAKKYQIMCNIVGNNYSLDKSLDSSNSSDNIFDN